MTRKIWIILPIVVVVVAAALLGLFAAGVFNKDDSTPVAAAQEYTASASEQGVFKDLGTDAYFDIRASKKPTNVNMDNYVTVTDNKGNKVELKVDNEANLGAGVYRITARDGFKARASYEIRVYDATFASDEYKAYRSFIFTTKGDKQVSDVDIKANVKETALAGTTVKTITQGTNKSYVVTLSSTDDSYAVGDVILAQKPDDDLLDKEYSALTNGGLDGTAYENLAAYYVTQASEVKDGKTVVTCRLAKMAEVFDSVDIYQDLTINEENFSFDEEAFKTALESSPFAESLLVAAQDTLDFFEKSFKHELNDGSKGPHQVVTFTVGLDGNKVKLNIAYTITIAKGVEIVVGIDNTAILHPSFNCNYDTSDFQFDFALNMDTETRCYVEMNTSDKVISAATVEEFKTKFVELLKGNTTEKAIVGKELPIYSYKYPIYCFVLGVEFGVDLNFSFNGELGFSYLYNTNIVAGVTYVNDDFTTYKSMTTSQTAKDLVLMGKVEAKAGVYVKLSVSVLEVIGAALKVKAGAYAELAGQLRLDVEAALNKSLHIIKGYYVVGGLYLGLDVQVKAGVELPVIGYKGFEKTWPIVEEKFPLFEFGSKYLVNEVLSAGGYAVGSTIEMGGKSVEFNEFKVNAFNLYTAKDALGVTVNIDSFNVEYVDDAADYITVKDGRVTVNPTVGTEFSATVKLVSKSDDTVAATFTFHKSAVVPTCQETTAVFDKVAPANVTFYISLNESTFVGLSGAGIAPANYDDANGTLVIYSAFLNALPLGEYSFLYKTNKGVVNLTVTVTDSTPITTEAATKTYLKSAGSPVVFSLGLNGNKVASIDGLKATEYYVNGSGTLTVYGIAFDNKAVGEYTYTVHASNGTDLALNVIVKDDRAPRLYTTAYGFSKNSATRHNVKVTFEKYAYAIESVRGNGIATSDYRIKADENYVEILGDFLAKLFAGTYTFELAFRSDKDYVYKPFTVNVGESFSLIAGSSYAVFDKNAPADAAYTVYTTAASVTLEGNGISKKNYAFSGNTLKLYKSFLATLAEGEYTFTAKASGASADFKLEVVDTTLPEIENAVGGRLALTYDKKVGGNLTFDMTLGKGSLDITGNGILSQDVTTTNENGALRVSIKSAYMDSLAYGEYEFDVFTGVNHLTLVVKVTNSEAPYATSATVLTYKGEKTDAVVTFETFGSDLAALEVVGSDAPAIGEYIFDKEAGTFTLTADYLQTLTNNNYTTFVLTFNDKAATTLRITITVTK